MASPDGLAAGVDVVGRLAILSDDVSVHVEFRGGAIAVTLPDLRALLRLRRRLPRDVRRRWARLVRSTLARMGLELRVFVGNHEVGRLGPTSQRGWLAALLGVDPVELEARAILAALFGRDSTPVEGVGPDRGPTPA